MKLFKNYKKLYETELNNRKVLEEARRELSKDCKKYQEQRNELNMELAELTSNYHNLKEEYARVRLELEDTKAYLEQEKQVSTALRKERANLKRKLTNLNKYEQENVFEKKKISFDELENLMKKGQAPNKIEYKGVEYDYDMKLVTSKKERIEAIKKWGLWNNGGYHNTNGDFFVDSWGENQEKTSKKCIKIVEE